MMQGKQAKIVSPTQERAILGYLATTRYPVVYLLAADNSLACTRVFSLFVKRKNSHYVILCLVFS